MNNIKTDLYAQVLELVFKNFIKYKIVKNINKTSTRFTNFVIDNVLYHWISFI